RLLSGEFSITGKYVPLYIVNSANPSFVAHVEVKPQARLKIKVEADLNGMTPLGDARLGTTKFIRINAVGANIDIPAAPTVANGAAGTPNGTYKCQVTFVSALGETLGGTEATATPASQHISWSNIPLGPPGTTGRSLYRTAPSGASGTEKKLTAGGAAT